MGSGRLSTSIVSWVCEPADKLGAGARPARVTHCRFEHAGQNFGSLDRGPRAAHPMEWDWRASEVGARRKTKQKPAMVEPVEILDARIRAGCRAGRGDRRGQGGGQGVCAAAGQVGAAV